MCKSQPQSSENTDKTAFLCLEANIRDTETQAAIVSHNPTDDDWP